MREIRHEQEHEEFPKCHDKIKCQCDDCKNYREKTLKMINKEKLGVRGKNEKSAPRQYRSDINRLFNLDH